MKPNFALFLSDDRIRLLHRSASKWRLIGEADTRAENLADELAFLRRTASALEPGGVRCKLVLPDALIRYQKISTPGATDKERREAALASLKEATPYAVEELAFDIAEDGDETQIAAIARETLAEAEAFAVGHRMHPVSFVAAPEGSVFFGEPFFGETEAAADLIDEDDRLERDLLPLSEGNIDQSNTQPPLQAEIPASDDAPLDDEDYEDDTEAADISYLEPEPDEEEYPLDTAHEEHADKPDFVSRRTVPTFRTQDVEQDFPVGLAGASEGAVPGFGEDASGWKRDLRADKQIEETHLAASALRSAQSAQQSQSDDEKERLTVFGARQQAGLSERGRRIVLVCAVLIIVPLCIAAFASGAVTTSLAGLFDRTSAKVPAAQFSAPLQPDTLAASTEQPDANPTVALASLDSQLTDEDAAVLEALGTPSRVEIAPETPRPFEELEAGYALTGIWPAAPEVPKPPTLIGLEDLYVTSIDPINPNFDAVALPALRSLREDMALLEPAPPAPAGTVFVLNERGLVEPSRNGTLNPDGILVFSGPPPARQPAELLRVEDPGEDLAQRILLAGFRPKIRPDDLIESNERATLSGLTRSELGRLRPRLRPKSAQENAAAAASLVRLEDGDAAGGLIQPGGENDFDGATARAVAASLRPDARPNNFSAIVARVQRDQQAAPKPAVATASIAPRSVAPKIPSSASAAREATVKNAINLRKINLIGVYGAPSSRRALVRLSNGSYRKLKVGDSLDGGQVSAIGDAELRYVKRGRAVVLKMPRG